MKYAAVLLLLLQDPKTAAEKAIASVRSQKSYTTKFKAEIRVPNSDPLVIEGETLFVNPGILFIHYKGSGGDEKRIIRVGDKVWLYHEFVEDWVTSEDMGNPGAGRGIQNPDEVLGVLSRHLENAKDGGKEKIGARECALVDLALSGGDIEKIMKEQASQGSFDWKKSRADVRLWIADSQVHKFTSAAELVSTEENIKGQKVKYTAEVEVTGYNGDTRMKFTVLDEKTRKPVEVKPSEPIEKAIAEQLKKKP